MARPQLRPAPLGGTTTAHAPSAPEAAVTKMAAARTPEPYEQSWAEAQIERAIMGRPINQRER